MLTFFFFHWGLNSIDIFIIITNLYCYICPHIHDNSRCVVVCLNDYTVNAQHNKIILMISAPSKLPVYCIEALWCHLDTCGLGRTFRHFARKFCHFATKFGMKFCHKIRQWNFAILPWILSWRLPLKCHHLPWNSPRHCIHTNIYKITNKLR